MTTADGVFINCPFDDAYHPVHNAIVLTSVTCGFEPRSALESGSAAVPRMQRISQALRSSRYSVHDLTRAHGDPTHSNLSRFNMPFEFGMAFDFAESTGGPGVEHDWLALVPEQHRHAEFISDLAGYDLQTYSGTASSVVPPLMAWLTTRPTSPALPPEADPSAVIGMLDDYEELLAAEDIKWGGHLPWNHRVGIARDLVAARLG